MKCSANFRKKNNHYKEVYPEENFVSGFAIPKSGTEKLVAKRLYRDEAAIISATLQREQIFHNVTMDEDGFYEVSIAYDNIKVHHRVDRLVFALNDSISGLIENYVIWEIGEANCLECFEDGITLNKVVSENNGEEACCVLVDLLLEYIQKILED